MSPCDKIYLSGPPHKNYNFNYTSHAGDQCASSRQISSKWVKRFQIQSDLTFFFKMAAVRHRGFVAALGGLYCCSKMVEIHAAVSLF